MLHKNLSIVTLLLLCVIFILPFVTVPTWYDTYEYPKFLIFVIATQLALWICIIKQILTPSPDALHLTPLSYCVLLFIAVSCIADITGLDAKTSLLGSEFRHQGFIMLFSGGLLSFLLQQDKKETYNEIFSTLIFVSTFFLTLIPIIQGITYHFFNYFIITYQGRMIGTFGNPDYLGAYLACLLPFIVFGENTSRKLSKQQLFLTKSILSMMILAAILLSGSRSALFAFALVFIVFVFRLKDRLVRYIVLFAALAGIFLLATHYKPALLRHSQWDTRSVLWQVSLNAIEKRPLLGYGQENFDLIFPKERHLTVTSTHNIFLELALSSGILGLLCFVGILFFAFKRGTLTTRLFLIVFLVTGIFNPLSISEVVLFWLVLGLINIKLQSERIRK